MKKLVIRVRKVQSVSKCLFLIIFCFCCLSTNGQKKIIGKYYLGINSNGGASLNFFKNGDFTYKEGGDLGEDNYGQGVYSFKNKKLILNFNKTKLGNLSSYSNYKIWQNNKDIVEIIINVQDLMGKPIAGVNIFCREYKLIKQTNENGIVILHLPKKTKNTEINVAFLGFKKTRTLINLWFNYKLTVYLSEGELEGVPILNQIDTLNIVSFKDTYFKVKNKDGKIITWEKTKS